MRRRYPVRPRANTAPGFWGCRFCRGAGCLACEAQANRQYAEQFPEGPEPILTITAEYTAPLAAMQDDGCPNVESPFVFRVPDADDSEAAQLARAILAALPPDYEGARRIFAPNGGER